MAFLAPNIVDILHLCRIAWDTTVKFRNAPSDLQVITQECHSFWQLLGQVDQEIKDPFSPVQVNDNGQRFLQRNMAEYEETLFQLQLKCSEYDKHQKMRAKEKARFTIADFSEERQQLKKHKDDINLQMHFLTQNRLNRILKEIHQLCADVRAGRRTTLLGGRGTVALSSIGGLSTKDFIKEELLRSAPDLSGTAIDQDWPEIAPYVEMLREKGGFDELFDDVQSINPSDSASHAGDRVASPRAMSAVGVTGSGWPVRYQGVPIEVASSWTILNAAYDFTGHDRPDTCDIWAITVACSKVRNHCNERMKAFDDLFDKTATALRSLHEYLSLFTPALLLTLASSSSDRAFWDRLSRRQRFVTAGRKLFQALKGLIKDFEGEPNRALSEDFSLVSVPDSPRRRFRSFSSLKGSRKTETIKEDSVVTDKSLDLCARAKQGLNEIRILCRDFAHNFIDPPQWNHYLKECGPGVWMRKEFEVEMHFYLSEWRKRLKTKAEAANGSAVNVDENLFAGWIAASQGIDVLQAPRSGLDQLFEQMHFEVDADWTKLVRDDHRHRNFWRQRLRGFELQATKPERPSSATSPAGLSDGSPKSSHRKGDQKIQLLSQTPDVRVDAAEGHMDSADEDEDVFFDAEG